MGKGPKPHGQKKRLDDGSSGGGFIGFSAFAKTSPQQAASSPESNGFGGARPSPIYTGNLSLLRATFAKLKKKDPTTKVKALTALCSSTEEDGIFSLQSHQPKTEIITALSHYAFVFHTSAPHGGNIYPNNGCLAYDNTASVRVGSLQIWASCLELVPKATKSLLLFSTPGETVSFTALGTIYSLCHDSSREVATAASQLMQAINLAFDQDQLQSAILEHLLSVLVHVKPPPKSSKSDKEDNETFVERYDRTMLSTLDSLSFFFKKYPETDTKSYLDTMPQQSPKCLWKQIATSNQAAFRNATYRLLSSCVQFAPSLVDFSSSKQQPLVATLLQTAIACEKSQSNPNVLFESLVLYLRHVKQNSTTIDLSYESLVRSLANNQFRKACHGCPARQWSPLLLPLLAALPSHATTLQMTLITSVWEGIESATSPTDRLYMCVAISECCSYMSKDSQSFEIFFKVLKWYLIECPPAANMRTPMEGLSAQLGRRLCQDWQRMATLSDNTFRERHTRLFLELIKEQDEIHNRNTIQLNLVFLLQTLASTQTEKMVETLLPGLLIMVNYICITCRTVKGSSCSMESLSSCSMESLLCLEEVFKFCGVAALTQKCQNLEEAMNLLAIDNKNDLSKPISIESFIMNDLLQWTIIFGSSDRPQEAHRAERISACFSILHHALDEISLPSKKQQLWEAFLGEIIQAKCHLGTLTVGLQTMSKLSNSCLFCPALDAFAMEVGVTTEEIYLKSSSESAIDLHHELELEQFLKTCVGLTYPSQRVVSDIVLNTWVDTCCSDRINSSLDFMQTFGPSHKDILLEVLIQLTYTDGEANIGQDEILKLFLETWFRGGLCWKSAIDSLGKSKQNNLLYPIWITMIGVACNALKNVISEVGLDKDSETKSKRWAELVTRIFDVNKIVQGNNAWSLVDLDNYEFWQESRKSFHKANFLSRCLLNLIGSFESPAERRSLLLSSPLEQSSNLFVEVIQTCILNPSNVYFAFYTNNNKAMELITLLGGAEGIGAPLLETCCNQIVSSLSALVQKLQQGNSIKKQSIKLLVQALDLLLGELAGDQLQRERRNLVDAYDVRNADVLWYVDKDERGRETGRLQKVLVTKVHNEDLPNAPYFSIRDYDGQGSEKQTVAARLRRSNIEPTATNNRKVVSKLEERIVSSVVIPCVSIALSSPKDAIKTTVCVTISELLHAVLTKGGLFGPVGVGTVRHDVFSLCTSLESRIINIINEKLKELDEADVIEQDNHNNDEDEKDDSQPLPDFDLPDFCDELRILALVFGGGCHAEPKQGAFSVLKFDPLPSSMLLCKFLVRDRVREKLMSVKDYTWLVDVVKWLSISISSISDEKMLKLSASALDVIAETGCRDGKKVLSEIQILQHLSVAIIGLHKKATSMGCSIAAWLPIPNATKLVNSFMILAPNSQQESTAETMVWQGSFQRFVRISCHIEGFLSDIIPYVEKICKALFTDNKRWVAFQLLSLLVRSGGKSLGGEISPKCQKSLEKWCINLPDEEAEELQEDVEIACQIIPANIAEDFLRLQDESLYNDENVAIGRFLSWLILLTILDSYDQHNAQKKGAVISYIQQTKVGAHILSLTLLHIPIESSGRSRKVLGKDRSEWKYCTSLEGEPELLNLQSLSALVLFRTMQSLPTLSKLWWMDDCHRASKDYVKDFAQELVAPETLKEELVRIKESEALEGMDVSGSVTTREVSAVYEQDEMKLSVMIRLPAAFPLRNVEVDCQKTLGIPEKRWRRWALLIMMMLNNQDGSVLDALLLWKENVDKEFEGVEPCPVCYAVICLKTHTMPNLECRTCSNRFHSSCLYKWFHSSGKSQCVMCQQPWSGTKVQH